MMNRVSAVFDNRSQAEQAIMALRQMGVNDAHLSIVARHGDDATMTGGGSAAGDAAADTAGNTGRVSWPEPAWARCLVWLPR